MKLSGKLNKIGELSFFLYGLGALLWLLLRSGLNPKRLNYPCQRAAMPVAASWVLAIFSVISGSLFLKRFVKYSTGALVAISTVWLLIAVPGFLQSAITQQTSLPAWRVENPVSTLYVLDSIPLTSGSVAAGDATVPDEYLNDPAIDSLCLMMETDGLYLHQTATHPDGIVGADNVVIIKGNFQWESRNTTSTDRIKGVVRQILNHPDGFSGEIIICDNTQDIGTGINIRDNNSEDNDQSILSVVNTFAAKGYPVYAKDWRDFWETVALEYSDGDYEDGFCYDNVSKVSYPKFRTPSEDYYVSLSLGVWDSLAQTYDESKLCIIDFPVLKAHYMAGSTVALKNWIGVMTTAFRDMRYGGMMPMHDNYLFGSFALVARIFAETYPDLTIVDATWTTTQGPIDLAHVVETRALVVSTDPVAASWYAAKFILTPIASQPYHTDPDNVGGDYHDNLSHWTSYLQNTAGIICTRDSSEITVLDRGLLFDSDGDGVNDAYDNCLNTENPSQDDEDGDLVGDACDICSGFDDRLDEDSDGVPNGCDICPGFDDLADSDFDGFPDGCDICPGFDDNIDTDQDGIPDGCDYVCGDANDDKSINVGDAVYLINHIFHNGPAPEPTEAGDANCDGSINVGDGVYLINFVFREDSPEPCATCP